MKANLPFIVLAVALCSASAKPQATSTKSDPGIEVVLVCPESEANKLIQSGFIVEKPTLAYVKSLGSRGFHVKKLDEKHFGVVFLPVSSGVSGISQGRIDAIWKALLSAKTPTMLQNLNQDDRKIVNDIFKMYTGFSPESGSVVSASMEEISYVESNGKTFPVTTSTTERKSPVTGFSGLPCLPVGDKDRLDLANVYGSYLSPNKEANVNCKNWSCIVGWNDLPKLYSKAMEFYGELVNKDVRKRNDDFRNLAKGLEFKRGSKSGEPDTKDIELNKILGKGSAGNISGKPSKEVGRDTFLNLTFVYNNAGHTESFTITHSLGPP